MKLWIHELCSLTVIFCQEYSGKNLTFTTEEPDNNTMERKFCTPHMEQSSTKLQLQSIVLVSKQIPKSGAVFTKGLKSRFRLKFKTLVLNLCKVCGLRLSRFHKAAKSMKLLSQ